MLKVLRTIRLSQALPVFFCSQAKVREAILFSQYHKVGLHSTPFTQEMSCPFDHHLPLMQQTQLNLDSNRAKVLQVEKNQKLKRSVGSKGVYEEYFDCYVKLISVVKECPLDNEAIYKTIGWYNMISFYRLFLISMLETKNEKELVSLANCLSQMHYTWDNPYGTIDQKLFKRGTIPNFYQRLSQFNLPPSLLRKIEALLPVPLNFYKRQYYHTYFNQNIESLLVQVQKTENYNLSDLVWLFNTYIQSMNDDPQGITIFEQHLVSKQPSLEHKDIERLMQAYERKGQINKTIYTMYIKPYILKNKMTSLEGLINTIKFTILSESGDMHLMRDVYEMVGMKYKGKKLARSIESYTLHLYTHYLLTKQYKIKLPDLLERQLISFCQQRAEGRDSISSIIDSQRSAHYSSPCLDLKYEKGMIREFEETRRSNFQEQFSRKLSEIDLKDYYIFEKPVFCCFQLDYVLKHKQRAEYIDVELEGIQYVFASGKMARNKQIRDQILKHYGFKIIHLNYHQLNKSPDQQLHHQLTQ